MGRDPKLLITGGNGQVGLALRHIEPGGIFLSRHDLDVTAGKQVRDRLRSADSIVHLAAMTDVDRCEREPERASEVNLRGAQQVAEAANAAGAYLVFLSTDYVFDGALEGEYEEPSDRNPLNVYGRTKALAEDAVLTNGSALVIRTSTIFGDGANFVTAILRAAESRSLLEVVKDQASRPTWAIQLAAGIGWCLQHRPVGVLHVAGDGLGCTRAEFARAILSAAGSSTEVEEVSTAAWASRGTGMVATRPPNSVLCLDKAREMGVPLMSWEEGLRLYMKEL